MNYKKLTGAGIAAIGFILFSFLVWPLFKGLGEARANIESKQAALEERRNVFEKVRSLKKTVASKNSDIQQLGTILPADKKTEEIVVNIEEAAKQAGFSLRELKTAEVLFQAQKTDHKILQVTLSGSGNYGPILNFFQSLEKNLRIFDVQEFTLSLDSAGEAAGLLNLDLKLFTYYIDGQ